MRRNPHEGGGTLASICGLCVWRHNAGVTCEAYPSGIPSVFDIGLAFHTQPASGDAGKQFALDPEGAWQRPYLSNEARRALEESGW